MKKSDDGPTGCHIGPAFTGVVIFSNPFAPEITGMARDEAVRKYAEWLPGAYANGVNSFRFSFNEMARLSMRGTVYLVDDVEPEESHGRVLKEFIENLISYGVVTEQPQTYEERRLWSL